jgi:GT2 family glycosyltransferase
MVAGETSTLILGRSFYLSGRGRGYLPNGALVSREVLARVGYPRSDYFMMFEEWEFCLRVRNAGFRVLLLPMITIHDQKVGSAGTSPPWRGYYQTRNHLAMALKRRSAGELFWWAHRQVKFVVAAMMHLDSKRERTRLRLLGAWHALRERMGRTIDPVSLPKR